MKRRVWLLALFGVGVAAQVPQSSENVTMTAWSRPKPKNSQCPVCWAMAGKYTQAAYTAERTTYWEAAAKVWQNAPFLAQMKNAKAGPRLVRCKACNAAFWQDAE